MNKWTGTGRLVADPELKFTPSKGTPVTTFKTAVDNGFGDDKKTYFIPIVVWGKAAESVAEYTMKGSKVAVSGKITTRSYEAGDGTNRYVTEVAADMYGGVEFLDNKNSKQDDNTNTFNSGSFDAEIIPVDDGDVPF